MVTSPALLVLLAVLATARLTTLIVDDYITARLRGWLAEHGRAARYWAECPWCVSVWTGTGVALVVYLWRDYGAVQVGLLAAAASEVTGLLAVARTRLEGETP